MKHAILALTATLCFACCFFTAESARAAGGGKRMTLPRPETGGGMGLMEALSKRASERDLGEEALSEQTLSNILWAAFGVNRPSGKRTIPTSRNRQEFQVYAVLESGVWLYDAAGNELVQALAADLRSRFGGAALTLLYAGPKNEAATGMHAGSAYQNVGLFCASAGLGNVVKTTGVVEANAMRLPLPEGYAVVVVQSVGKR